MIVLSIDPGYERLGFALIEFTSECNDLYSLISYGLIHTDKNKNFYERLKEISKNLFELIDKYKPDQIAIEEQFFNKNKKTLIKVAEVKGLIYHIAIIKDIPIYQYSPLQVKSIITGYGRATKFQMQSMIKRIFKLNHTPKPDDVADAIGIGIAHIWQFTNKLSNL